MHQQWLDLIPYYAAGTLPITRAHDLERHLNGCEWCRRALHEWQSVARLVQTEADAWTLHTPPMSASLRAQIGAPRPSSNGTGSTHALTEMQEKTIRVAPAPRPAPPARRLPLPLTLAAAVFAVLLIGGVLLALSRGGDNKSSSQAARPTNLVPRPQTGTPTRTPLGTPPPITADPGVGSSSKTATFTPFLTYPTRTHVPPTSGVVLASPTNPPAILATPTNSLSLATPTALYGTEIGMGGFRMMTLTQVGDIPPNTRIRISHAWYDSGWIYAILTEGDLLYAEAREWQIGYAPGYEEGPTPTAVYGEFIGQPGYPLVTNEQIGEIPPNSPVRLSYGYYGMDGWLYGIVMMDEMTMAEARVDQLRYASDNPTPTWTPSPISPPQIHSFKVSPNPVKRGELVTLRWQVTGASYVVIYRVSENDEILEVLGEGLPWEGEVSYIVANTWASSTVLDLRLWDWQGNQSSQNLRLEIVDD